MNDECMEGCREYLPVPVAVAPDDAPGKVSRPVGEIAALFAEQAQSGQCVVQGNRTPTVGEHDIVAARGQDAGTDGPPLPPVGVAPDDGAMDSRGDGCRGSPVESAVGASIVGHDDFPVERMCAEEFRGRLDILRDLVLFVEGRDDDGECGHRGR